MAIFEKDKTPVASGAGTVVGSNVKLTGILKDTNDIIVHGTVEGEVVSEHNVTITETSEIKGPITAANITIAGKVTGNIQASQKLEILSTGRVYGSIATKELIIKSGAIFIGKSVMPESKNDRSIEPKDIKKDEDKKAEPLKPELEE